MLWRVLARSGQRVANTLAMDIVMGLRILGMSRAVSSISILGPKWFRWRSVVPRRLVSFQVHQANNGGYNVDFMRTATFEFFMNGKSSLKFQHTFAPITNAVPFDPLEVVRIQPR